MARHPPSLAGIAVALLVLALFFGIIERIAPAIRGLSIWRWHRRIDFLYWFFTPIVTRTASTIAVAVTAFAVVAMTGRAGLLHGAVARQPRLVQLLELLLLADLVGYWSHRAFHKRPLWHIHAIHHSSTDLDWLAASRVHPLNEILTRSVQVIPFLLLGFRGDVVAGLVPLLTLYAIFLHANVTWDFGPFRYLLASPAFHRWHHTSEEAGLDHNFAGMFPWLDLLFGTLYLPKGKQPATFGIAGDVVPATFLGQLLYPLRPAQREHARPV
jgi:sterol desaturase/sphingolipid hydroxylase (fatty acid hydroxylase superfamily)